VTDYVYSKVAVYAELGGALRLARRSRTFATDTVTGLPVNVTQSGFTAPYLDTDNTGIADFTATTPGPIRLTTGATFVDVFSEEMPGLGLAAVTSSAASASDAAASAAAAALSASLVGAPADTAVATIVGNPASATRVSLSSTYGRLPDPAELTLFVTPRGSDANDGLTLKSAKATISAALVAGGTRIQCGVGTIAQGATSCAVSGNTAVLGAGRGLTTITYTGAGALFTTPTPGARTYNQHFQDLTVSGPGIGTTAVGFDLDSISSAEFRDVTAANFGTGFALHSAINGGAVYNDFSNTTASGCGIGFNIAAGGSNGARFRGCRANICTTGVKILDSNNAAWSGGQIEGCTTGINVDASSSSLADACLFENVRFEGNTTAWVVGSVNVRDFMVLHPRVFGTYTTTDNGSRTQHITTYTTSSQNSFVQSASGCWRWERSNSAGTELPAVVFVDSNNSTGVPVTVQIETARGGGYALRTKRGATTYFDVGSSDGTLRWLQDVTLGRVAAGTLGVGAAHCLRTGKAVTASRPSAVTVGAGAVFYDTTLVEPIWSDGTVWRDAAGTAV